MERRLALVAAALATLCSACGKSTSLKDQHLTPGAAGMRVLNAYDQPVNVLVDGAVVASGVQPGQLDTAAVGAGSHTVALSAGSSTSASVLVRTDSGSVVTVAALRWGSSLAASELEDTNAIVPTGATKVRVLHLAPNAGEIQVFRTQPDWATPIEWLFPFVYDSVSIRSLTYMQSTVGTWEIRAWRKPSEVALGWDGTTARVTLNLASGEKRTVVVLDAPGGGIYLSVLE